MSKATVSVLIVHLTAYCSLAVLWPPEAVFQAAALAAALVWVSIVDFQTFEIPDSGWVLVLVMGCYHQHQAGLLLEASLAALIWPSSVLMLAWAHSWFRGRTGLGLGDIKLLSGIGAWTGLDGTIWVVMAAALGGIATILALALLRGASMREASTNMIAFGPFLCLSCWTVVLQEGRI